MLRELACIEHIERALDALHKLKYNGHQTEINRAWDDLINAKARVEAIANANQESTKDN